MSSLPLKNNRLGGLHLSLIIGDSVKIKFGGEVLELIFQGKNGHGKYVLSFIGPKSFQVERVKIKGEV